MGRPSPASLTARLMSRASLKDTVHPAARPEHWPSGFMLEARAGEELGSTWSARSQRRGRTTLTPGTTGAELPTREPLGGYLLWEGDRDTAGPFTRPRQVGGQADQSRLPGISSRRSKGAWWGAGHSQAGSITYRPRHRGGGHAERRTRALAVSDPAHPALPAWARQRISPSRRP